jgi:predicted metal-dependent HD superfamily phosphohydrolase
VREAAGRSWRELLAGQDPDPAQVDAAFTDLSCLPRSPDRWSDGPRRRLDVLHWIERLEHRARDPHAVRLAAWAAEANGHALGGARWSALWLPRVGVQPPVLADVERLLTVLRQHDPDDDDADGEVLCDADWAVLGAPANEYRDYVDRLRRDSDLPEAAWLHARRRAVRELLNRDSVFRTPEMRAAREGRAQLNLAREAAALCR